MIDRNQPTQVQKLFIIYKKVKNPSIKHDSYFQVYEEIFNKYIGKELTFVEIGVLNGGSLHWCLFMMIFPTRDRCTATF